MEMPLTKQHKCEYIIDELITTSYIYIIISIRQVNKVKWLHIGHLIYT